MSASSKLQQLAATGFAMAGESVPLGFDPSLIGQTIAKMPAGISVELQGLMAKDWPADFFLGVIDFLGPTRINSEHQELYPGLGVIAHGFFGFASDGSGGLFTHCTADDRVYRLSSDNFSDDGLHTDAWDKLELTPENIKSVALASWDSLETLLDWALVELEKLKQESETEG